MVARTSALILVSVVVLGGLFLLLRPDAPDTAPGERSFDLEINQNGMRPEEVSVREGDRVTMSIRSDSRIELHIHGYDLEWEVEPDETTDLSFEADLTGRFPMEDHETESELGVLVVEPR
jgi:hypothetical protein